MVMVSELEKRTEYWDYELIDLLPLMPIRHLPKILRTEDSLVRYYDTVYNAVMVAAELFTYYNLFQLIKNN